MRESAGFITVTHPIRMGVMLRMAAAAILVLTVPSRAESQTAMGIDRLAWLEGCWEATSPKGSVEEQWMAPRGGSMIGMSRTVRDGRLTGHELVVIREDGDRLLYQAHPSGQASATFRSFAISEDSVVFENPEHDFPQRIGYRRAGADLLAWIEGTQAGTVQRGEFPYQRVTCAGTPDIRER